MSSPLNDQFGDKVAQQLALLARSLGACWIDSILIAHRVRRDQPLDASAMAAAVEREVAAL